MLNVNDQFSKQGGHRWIIVQSSYKWIMDHINWEIHVNNSYPFLEVFMSGSQSG